MSESISASAPLAVVCRSLPILASPFQLMHHSIACQKMTHGLTGTKHLARCLTPSPHVPMLPKKYGGNPNPTSSMKFISHMHSSHKKLASTSKTLIKLSSIAQLAFFKTLLFVLQMSYILQTSIAPPATDGSTLLISGIVTRAVRDDARPGTTPLLCQPMMDSCPPPPPHPPSPPLSAAASLLTYGASNAPGAKMAEATKHPSTTNQRGPHSVPHEDRPDPGMGVPFEVRDVHENLAPVTGDVKKVKKGGIRWKQTTQVKLSLHNARPDARPDTEFLCILLHVRPLVQSQMGRGVSIFCFLV
jgi:hypothetical protein